MTDIITLGRLNIAYNSTSYEITIINLESKIRIVSNGASIVLPKGLRRIDIRDSSYNINTLDEVVINDYVTRNIAAILPRLRYNTAIVVLLTQIIIKSLNCNRILNTTVNIEASDSRIKNTDNNIELMIPRGSKLLTWDPVGKLEINLIQQAMTEGPQRNL